MADFLDKVIKPVSKVAAPLLKELAKDKNMDPNWKAALTAPVHLAEGNPVHAANSLATAFRAVDGIGHIMKTVDDLIKTDKPASANDYYGIKILKHRTTTTAGDAILASHEMRAGKEGVLGAGVYFATTEQSTEVKAVHGTDQAEPYAMVTASVNLGNVRVVEGGEREWRMIVDKGFDQKDLERLNYQSVGSFFNGGWEFCVFDPKRVEVVDVDQYGPGEKPRGSKDHRKTKVCTFHDPKSGSSCRNGDSCEYFHLDTTRPGLAYHFAKALVAAKQQSKGDGKGKSATDKGGKDKGGKGYDKGGKDKGGKGYDMDGKDKGGKGYDKGKRR